MERAHRFGVVPPSKVLLSEDAKKKRAERFGNRAASASLSPAFAADSEALASKRSAAYAAESEALARRALRFQGGVVPKKAESSDIDAKKAARAARFAK